jgi:CheY-like chemotaxis protein
LHLVKPPPLSARPLILCLEDDESYLYLRQAVLQQAGYNVIGVSTARDALQALREAPICLILADHMLRGTTGTEVAAKMKQIRPDVPIVLFSGNNPDSMKNVDLFINKDVPTAKFLAILRDVLNRYCS